LTGWTSAEAVGRPLETVFRIVNEATREPAENPVARALRHGVAVALANHTVLVAKAGDERAIEDSAAPITDARGRISGCVLVFRDVTVQRRVARERANQLQTARMLVSIIESSDDAIVAKSLDGIIQSWNAGAERIFRHTAAYAIGRHISIIVPPDRLAEEEDIIARLAKGERIDHVETERVRADGRRLIVSLTISPILDEAGRVVGASNITRDVTQQRAAERRERHLLAEADRHKNEFLAMLAHELRTPLAPISNTARALQLEGADRDEVRMASEILERQVRQMSRLVDDLLDMSRITRGRIEIRKSRVAFAPIVEQAVEAVRPMCASMQCGLAVELPEEPIYLEADAARLAQVLGNLVHNACKFTNPGGHAELTAQRIGDRLLIHVRDDGIGIAPEHLPHLFDMFVQVDTSLERSRGGLGIGLTLAKNLIEMHDGTVEVRSEGLGRGTEVVVTLPILSDERALPTPAPRAQTSAEANEGRRILIVDDNPDSADSLALLLRHSGFETHTTNDGLHALELAERVRPEAILLDIGLPGLNGYEVCRRMRSEGWGRDVVLVAMTGWGQDQDRIRSKDAGFDAHLVKPVDYDQLLALLEH
jgi:two-component system, chemotaxis family, CheB/CheR fusion protein